MIEQYSKEAPKNPQEWKQWYGERFHRVPVKPAIDAKSLPDNTELQRFMDLPKFLDLVAKQRLILPRLGRLMEGDPFECIAAETYDHVDRAKLEEYVLLREQYVPDHFQTYEFKTPCWLDGSLSSRSRYESFIRNLSDEKLRDAAWYLERNRLKEDLVCGCWYLGRQESDAMWRIYADHIGVSVVTSVARLKAGIQSCLVPKISEKDFTLTLEKVQYGDRTEFKQLKPWLIKRKSFQHEREVRLFYDCVTVSYPGLELIVDLGTLIKEIVVTPFAEEWQCQAIIAIIKSSCFKDLKIRQSDHMRPPENDWPSSHMSSDGSSLSALTKIIGKPISSLVSQNKENESL
jgi:hypothetical protein